MRIYLPDGVPVLQDLVPPLTSEGLYRSTSKVNSRKWH
jgi:hypothetical protein